MMKKRTKFIITGSLLVASVGFAAIGRFSNGSYQQQFAQNSQQVFSAAKARQSAFSTLVKSGMEPNSAGIHIVQPPTFATALSSSVFGTKRSDWEWFTITSGYPDTTWAPPGQPHLSSILVSTDRLIPNLGVVLSKFQSGSTWGIEGSFSQRSIDLLVGVHGPLQSLNSFKDWAGVLHPNGGFASEMQAALVTNGTSLLPFSVTDLIQLSGPQVVVFADGLTEIEVDQIIADF